MSCFDRELQKLECLAKLKEENPITKDNLIKDYQMKITEAYLLE